MLIPRFSSVYSLFLSLFFYFASCSPLSPLPFHYCYHNVMQSRAFGEFYCSPVLVSIRPDDSLSVSWPKRGCRFQKNFITVEQIFSLF